MSARNRAADDLEAVLSGEIPAADASAEVRAMALLAASVDEHTSLEAPAPAFRAELRERLAAETAAAPAAGFFARAGESVRERVEKLRHSGRAAMAAGLATSMLGTAGVAAAAQGALPGELLHPVKQATESVRSVFANGDIGEGRLQFALARERLVELLDGGNALSDETILTTLARMDTATTAGSDLLLAAYERDGAEGLLAEVYVFTDEQRNGISTLIAALPDRLVPAAEGSLDILAGIDAWAAQTVAECSDCADALTTSPDTALDSRLLAPVAPPRDDVVPGQPVLPALAPTFPAVGDPGQVAATDAPGVTPPVVGASDPAKDPVGTAPDIPKDPVTLPTTPPVTVKPPPVTVPSPPPVVVPNPPTVPEPPKVTTPPAPPAPTTPALPSIPDPGDVVIEPPALP